MQPSIDQNTHAGIQSNTRDGIDTHTPKGNGINTLRERKKLNEKGKNERNASEARRPFQPTSRKEKDKAVRPRRLLEKREAQLKKGRAARKDGSGFVPTRESVRQKWRLLMEEYFPDEPHISWPISLESAVAGYAKVWTEARKSGEFYDYLEFTFRNWRQIRVTGFGWMARCPGFPVAELFVSAKLRSIFEIAYAEKEKLERWAKLNEFEQRVERLIQKGIDSEVAENQVRQEFGFRDEEKHLKRLKNEIVILTDRMRQQAAVAKTGLGRKAKPLSEMKLEDFTWREEDG